MEMLNGYIVPVTLVVCLCVGYIVKHYIPTDKINKFIPLIVGLLGVIITAWNSDWVINPDILAIGLVSGLASTGLHELFRQFIDKN
ncbi:MAG: holin [Ruminococcaceae bacterium]|nr:holin [Oscillospiraceae bacterium]